MTAVIALVLGVMLVVFVVQQSSKPNNEINFGTKVFQAGQVAPLAKNVSEHGPIVFPALSSGGPDIYLQHAGSDVHAGWHAFDAQAAGEDRTCTLKWRAATGDFTDPCTNKTFGADGAGLRQYKTIVEGDVLSIDFRSAP